MKRLEQLKKIYQNNAVKYDKICEKIERLNSHALEIEEHQRSLWEEMTILDSSNLKYFEE